MEQLLEQIKLFADRSHGQQLRKYSPDRYIVHPVRVMETLKRYHASLPMLAAALLHDVLEDTAVTKEELSNFLLTLLDEADTAKTVKLVIELTDIYTKAAYPKWNRQKRKEKEYARLEQISPEAQTIKYADIMDNSKEIGTHDNDFAPVYLRECKAILERLENGNAELYREALDRVNNELAILGI